MIAHLLKFIASVGILIFGFGCSPKSDVSQSNSLFEGFVSPPNEAKPSAYFIMLNGYLNKEFVGEELEEYAEKGIGGLLVFDMGIIGDKEFFPPAGPKFMSDQWLDNFSYIVDKANDLGMSVELAACSSWDMGGSWVKPEDAVLALYQNSFTITGPQKIKKKLKYPELPVTAILNKDGNPVISKEVAVLAIPINGSTNHGSPKLVENVNSILDISDNLNEDGILEWEVPEGVWEIIRYVTTNTGEKLKIPNPASDGLATDHLSAIATRNHIKYMGEKLAAKLGDLGISALTNFYLPSYEVKGMIWTHNLPEQFKLYRNYDLIKFLPALNGYIIGNEEITNRFLYDYQKTMGELLVDAFYITASETAREFGMAIKSESAGPGPPVHLVPVEALKALSVVDEMQGEFWPWREHWDELWVVKETATAAHVYGRKLVHMEAFTGFRHWMDGPVDLKPSADRAFCEGMNHVVWHMGAHNPPEAGKPGWAYHAGSHFNVNLVWWEQMKPWLDYLARISYLLQQGLFVGDVIYYYGDQGANFVPPKHTNRSLKFGYDYDITNLDVMLNRMDVRDHKIVLPDGMSYEVLVLPNQQEITLEALERIQVLVEKGATVIGPKPTKSTGLYNYMEYDEAVKELANKLWGNIDGTSVYEHKFGKGKMVYGKGVNEVLAERGVPPDFQFSSPNDSTDLDFIHRRTEHQEIYFIRNKRDEVARFKASFRVKSKTPELWLPDTGEKYPQLVYEETKAGISFEMNLDKYGSVFVIFTNGASNTHLKSLTGNNVLHKIEGADISISAFENGDFKVQTADDQIISFTVDNIPEPIEITGEWKLSFTPGWGVEKSLKTSQLLPLSEFKDQEINYYSGMVKYENNFNVPEDFVDEEKQLFLDLGSLWLLADVSVNGNYLGSLWKAPYRIDVTSVVNTGINKLEIKVANTWSNRLIGDARHPDLEQYCKTNITGSGTVPVPWKDLPLRDSGLFGPVKLISAAKITLSTSN